MPELAIIMDKNINTAYERDFELGRKVARFFLEQAEMQSQSNRRKNNDVPASKNKKMHQAEAQQSRSACGLELDSDHGRAGGNRVNM
jgi:hypothetical protein